MYYLIVAALMLALPVLSLALEWSGTHAPIDASMLCKWFGFWSVGWRLLLAGVRQIVQPQYTAEVILGLKNEESRILVRELGFANLALGVLGVLSVPVPSWRLAVALAGGVFYFLAGTNHFLQPHRNRQQNVAMLSDVFVASVLLGSCVAALVGK
jgi:hypothetical protein